MSNVMTREAPKRPLAGEINDIMRLIEEFGSLLRRETEALKKADFAAVDTLQAPKRAMATQYQSLIVGLSSRKEEMRGLDMAAREKLVRARTQFTLILNDNLRALEAAKESTRRLVTRILDTARKAVVDEQQTNYSSRGQAQAYKTSTLSLTVDQKL